MCNTKYHTMSQSTHFNKTTGQSTLELMSIQLEQEKVQSDSPITQVKPSQFMFMQKTNTYSHL